MPLSELKFARTDTLEIAYEESGSSEAEPIFLLHGFPYDPRAYDAMVPRLVEAGYRTIVSYLRGYGPTRFLEAQTPRSGQQAVAGGRAERRLRKPNGLSRAHADRN